MARRVSREVTEEGRRALLLEPIGILSAPKPVKFDTPHQPRDGTDERCVIKLRPDCNFEQALDSLEGFERVWLIWWFDRNPTWRAKVLPPRGTPKRRGVFATRSPHRPNPVGITAVRLVQVDRSGLTVTVGNSDLVDGTPILDIKPYLPQVDAFPNSGIGWLTAIEQEHQAPPRFQVVASPLAREQLDWLAREFGVELEPRLIELLGRDPSPHKTRRIRAIEADVFRIACGAWRVFFRYAGGPNDQVELLHVTSGYPDRLLFDAGMERVPHRDAQVAFLKRWPRDLWVNQAPK